MKIILSCFMSLIIFGCATSPKLTEDKKLVEALPTEKQAELETVVQFKGLQVTGVTVTEDERIFANFPRWRDNVVYSVVEIFPDGTFKPFPDERWNDWKGKPEKQKFTCVQSVLAHGGSLFVLDPSNPKLQGVQGSPTLYEFDLASNKFKRSWEFDRTIAPKKSYLNDFRIDDVHNKIFITDSGIGGLIELDLQTNKSKRLLDNHPSTKSENIVLSIGKKEFFSMENPPKFIRTALLLTL